MRDWGGYIDIDPGQPFNLIDYKDCLLLITAKIFSGDTNTYIGSCTFDNTVNFDYASTDYIMIPVTYSNLFDDTGVNYKPCVAYISGYISNADTGKVTFRVWNLGVDSDIMERDNSTPDAGMAGAGSRSREWGGGDYPHP